MSRNEEWSTRKIFWVWGSLAFAALVIIPLAVWGFQVVTAGAKGRGDQIIQVNNATNRTEQYNHFFDLKATYDTQVIAVQNNKAALAADDPNATDIQSVQDRDADKKNVTGAETICAGTANQYNEDSAKVVTGAQFKSFDLPDNLDPGACK